MPPPGAKRLARPPGGVEGKLDHNQFMPGDPDFVDVASLWQVKGSPLRVLAWEKAHLPGRFTVSMTSGEAAPIPPRGPSGAPSFPADPYHFASDGYGLPAVPGVLISREMDVAAARSLAGQTYVRVDAEVIWLPQRPAAERVPAGVSVIAITGKPDMNRPKELPVPVAVTDPAQVRKIVALVDGLSLNPAGVHGCMMWSGKEITLSFLGHLNGPVLATISEPIPSCGGIQFVIRGTQQPSLGDWGSFAQQVLSIAGARWPGYNAPA